ncbi:MAG: ATP-binding protein [Paludibaculum sp.]
MPKSSAAQANLFDDALNPAPVAPLAESHEPRPAPAKGSGYSAKDIEVLEGLEPVRKRPGMYIGGTDERALHHLFAEVLDNAMDEAVAGHAKVIEVILDAEGGLTVKDDGRGIPVDPHPKHPGKSALEVIMTVLHSGGKFSGDAYETSGGLHGVGVSVVNALSERLEVTAFKDGFEWRQVFARGKPLGGIEKLGPSRKHGTDHPLRPGRADLRRRLRLQAGPPLPDGPLQGLPVRRRRDPLEAAIPRASTTRPRRRRPSASPTAWPTSWPSGSRAWRRSRPSPSPAATSARARPARSSGPSPGRPAGFGEADSFMQSYCNTVPTPEGGTHEAGLRAALTRGLKAYGELIGEKRGGIITADDVLAQAGALISVFIRNPEFQGQTKERLSSSDAQKLVETALRDPFDHWLTAQPKAASALLQFVVERSRGAAASGVRTRRSPAPRATRKLRLPGKLADCSGQATDGTELFLVEGDFGRRLGQAGARPQDPGDPAPARQDPQRRLGQPRQDRRQQGAGGPDAGAGRPGRLEVQGRGAALRAGRHHDRRRRGRRPHRQPADHLLLPHHAGR